MSRRELRADEVFILALAAFGAMHLLDWAAVRFADLKSLGLPGILAGAALLFWALVREYRRELER